MSDTELMATLKPVERELCKRLNVFNITGKKGRTVTLLLKLDVKIAMDLIVDKEEKENLLALGLLMYSCLHVLACLLTNHFVAATVSGNVQYLLNVKIRN